MRSDHLTKHMRTHKKDFGPIVTAVTGEDGMLFQTENMVIVQVCNV